jgi:RNA-directed DNA polymerase
MIGTDCDRYSQYEERCIPQYFMTDIFENTQNITWNDINNSSQDEVYHSLSLLLYRFARKPYDERMLISVCGSDNRDALYRVISIKKKRGGYRDIQIPAGKLKAVQRTLLRMFENEFKAHKCATGFVKKKNIRDHASLHTKKRWLYSLDIKDFFPSITWQRLYGMFMSYPFNASPSVARVLSNLTTYQGSLPQGAPTSPFLSNMICRKLDSRLYNWAKNNQYVYSRYADDITISTNKKVFYEEDQNFIINIIESEGFEINKEKVRLVPYFNRQLVTGLVVNQKVNTLREYARGVRAILHNIERYGWKSQAERELTSYFEIQDDSSINEYNEYKRKNINKWHYDEIKEKQRTDNLIINPKHYNLKIQNHSEVANKIKTFKRVVKGKIEFLGLIIGKDKDRYKHLIDKYEFLYEFEEGVDRISHDIHRQLKDIFEDLIDNRNDYREVAKRIDHASELEFNDIIQSFARKTIEINWKLNGISEINRKKKEAKRVIYSASLIPKRAGLFLNWVTNRNAIGGLVHRQDDDMTDINEILGRSESLIRVFRSNNLLPNDVRNECDKFIKMYKDKYYKSDDNTQFYDKYFNEIILPFRRKIRFDSSSQDQCSLPETIDNIRRELIERYSNHVKIITDKLDCCKIFTYTPVIIHVLKLLIESMYTNTKGDKIFISSEYMKENINNAVELDSTIIKIYDDKGSIEKSPVIKEIFGGKLKNAVGLLRGYAEWYIIAKFNDGNSYQFDVMNNKVDRLDEDIHKPINNVMHKLVFYW